MRIAIARRATLDNAARHVRKANYPRSAINIKALIQPQYQQSTLNAQAMEYFLMYTDAAMVDTWSVFTSDKVYRALFIS